MTVVAIDRLLPICENFNSWDDPLSIKLVEWVLDSREIDVLAKRILINSIDGKRLECPVIDGEWVWDRWMLDEYTTCCTLLNYPLNSPFTGEKIHGKRHEFAIALIASLGDILPKETSTSHAQSIAIVEKPMSIVSERYCAYQLAAMEAVRKKAIEKVSRQVRASIVAEEERMAAAIALKETRVLTEIEKWKAENAGEQKERDEVRALQAKRLETMQRDKEQTEVDITRYRESFASIHGRAKVLDRRIAELDYQLMRLKKRRGKFFGLFSF